MIVERNMGINYSVASTGPHVQNRFWSPKAARG